ncbi:MAG TPA: DUF6069 family protein [Streptosporangiaceae bacterium]|jgi:glucan phosphoethanolaminetransferase (alkaline phosphatase superfamily)|nr:DUF6069 family protein [Streptosporangiaceae bacterium]
MTIPMRNDEPAPRPRQHGGPDPGPLWAGGAATAAVAALIALVGILVSRWLLKVPILAPSRAGAWGDASTGAYIAASAGAAVVATAIMHLLLLATPRPQIFFGWIIALGTIIAVVFPFSTTAPVSQKVATAIVDLVLGIAIGSLINSVSYRAVRRTSSGGPGYQRSYPPASYPQSRTPGDDGYRWPGEPGR